MRHVVHVQRDIMVVNVMIHVLTVRMGSVIKMVASVQVDATMDSISFIVMKLALMVVWTAVTEQMGHVIHAQLVFMETNALAIALATANIISVTKSLEPVLVVKQTSMGRNALNYARDVWKGSVTRMMVHAHMAVCLDPVAYSVRTCATKCHLMAHVIKHLALQMIIMEWVELKQTKVNLLFVSLYISCCCIMYYYSSGKTKRV